MKTNKITINSFLAASIALSLNVHASDHDHNVKDFTYSAQSIQALTKNKLVTINEDQFVFNNNLALQDWDNIFASYFPHLKPHQEVIMHYAGQYSLNPKLLISLMESQSKIITSPSKKAFSAPFGNLSNKKGFKPQMKDVAKELSKRFYAYKKLTLKIDKRQRNTLSSNSPSSAATAAISSLLNVKNKAQITPTKPIKRTKPDMFQRGLAKQFPSEIAPRSELRQATPQRKTTLNNILNAYESIFAESSDKFTNPKNDGFSMLTPLKPAPAKQNNNVMQRAAARAAAPNLYLPWTSGYSFRAGGAHGFDGSSWPLSSLDFYYPYGNTGWGGTKPNIYSSHGGTVTWFSRCNMRVTHSSGIATNYYHMDNLQYASGSYINAGTYIGTYANTKSASLCEGGQSTGPHLHLSLIKNGYYTSLQGYNFSGYYIAVGSSQYDTNCNRNYLWKNGTSYCAGRDIYKPYE